MRKPLPNEGEWDIYELKRVARGIPREMEGRLNTVTWTFARFGGDVGTDAWRVWFGAGVL